MQEAIRSGKKLWAILITGWIMGQGQMVAGSLSRWSHHFIANKGSIAALTIVNTAITTTMEFAGRSLQMPFKKKMKDQYFFVTSKSGGKTINRQSMINIIMAIVGTLIGGPVFFFMKRSHRFLFFITFGIFNSCLGQGMAGVMLDGAFTLEKSRLVFAFFYSGTWKFLVFEFVRTPIVRAGQNIVKLGLIRSNQKFFSTFVKIQIIDLIGLGGR